MVEGTPLLRAHLGKTWIQGSNPCVSAITWKPAQFKAARVFLFMPFVIAYSTGTIHDVGLLNATQTLAGQ